MLFICQMPPNWLTGWAVGQKLEAVDKHTAALCVASVSNIKDDRVLIHFEGWEKDYDYWARPDAVSIRPKGWGDQNKVPLTKPKGQPSVAYFLV